MQAGSESKLQFGQSSPCLTGCCRAGGVQGDVQDGGVQGGVQASVQRCAVGKDLPSACAFCSGCTELMSGIFSEIAD